jgi:peptidoglycan/LPS O-acetylase OafA/YrhL
MSIAYPHIELPKVLDMSHNIGLLENVRSIVTWFFNISMLFLNIPSVFDLVIGPSWSVGIEVSFYIVAPFLLRLKVWPMLMLSIFGILLQLIPYGQHSPILFGFHFFLLGALARRYTFKIESLVSNIWTPPLWLLYATIFVILFFAIPGNIYIGPANNHAHNTVANFIYPVIIAGLIPLLHERTKNKKIDSWIGHLSYPFYLLHALVIDSFTGWYNVYKAPILLLLCLILSMIIVLFEIQFIEPWRSRFAYKRN